MEEERPLGDYRCIRYMKMIRKITVLIAVLVCAFSLASCLAASLVTYGKQNDDIYEIQLRLKELGYFPSEPDGYFGDETQTAIGNFQIANGIAHTGLADPETMERLKSDSVITKKEYIDAVRLIEKMDYIFQTGDQGKQVKRLQTFLSEKGYLTGDVTDEYTEEVATAVCLFQLINDLPVTGIADSDVVSLLCSPLCINLNECEMKIVLAYGDSGAAVKQLQLQLAGLGYFEGDCSAKFGKNTQDAVYEYQKWNGLEENGECGVEMRIHLAMGKAVSYAEALAMDAVSALYEGDISDAVQKVKTQLTDLGFYTGLIDNEFTHELSEAVYFFQLANEIQTTGSADKATRLLLNSGECITMDEFTEKLSEMPVKRDDVGHQVVLLQRRLIDLGYYFDSANGTFDKKTEEAVKSFQKAHDMEQTGVADTLTRKLMNSDEALTYADSVALEEMKKAEAERQVLVDLICGEAANALNAPYEAGRVGKDAYGNSGLTYAVYAVINMELHPTIALQYESAMAMENWNENPNTFGAGDQVFFFAGDTMLTGICVNVDTVIFASPGQNRVISVQNFTEIDEYVFIGSIAYI